MVLNLFLVALLILLTAFFVATEFAIIKLRSSRVDQLVLEGRRGALAVQKVTTHLDEYLSACQLGITITALGLGWLGEPTVEKMLHPLFHSLGLSDDLSQLLSFLIAFISITYLHVVLGELAPKSLAIQKAEAIAFLTAQPIIFFYKIMFPFIWLLNGSANALIGLFGLRSAKEHEDAHTEEEIQIIVSDSYHSGKINQAEYGYVNKIFAFDDLLAREIMVPRTDMVCLYINNTLEENLEIIRREQYTRFPVAQDSKDHIVGMINTKQFFLNYDQARSTELDFAKLIHPVLTVPEYIPINALLKRMQKERVHIAILADEYGGTAGIITMEDILEEIVGEIRDEFDADEVREVEKLGEEHYALDGKVLLNEVNDLFGTHIENEDVDTIGGWLYMLHPEMEAGDMLRHEGLTFKIVIKDTNRIRKVEVCRDCPPPESGDGTEDGEKAFVERIGFEQEQDK